MSRSCPAHEELARSRLGRRTILRSITALALIPMSLALMASEAAADVVMRKSRRLRSDRRYILFPINTESSLRRVQLTRNGRVLRSFIASLGLPAHWWAHLDVSAWQGKDLDLTIESDHSPPSPDAALPAGRGSSETGNAELLLAVHTSDEIWSAETLYKEPLRPLFH